MQRVRDHHFDNDNPDEWQLASRVVCLLRLRHVVARVKAEAVFVLMQDGEDQNPVRTVRVANRTLRVFNGGADRFGRLVDELIDAICRADPADPEIVWIVHRAASLCRHRHLPFEADLLLELLP